MLIHGFPITASLPTDPGFKDRFWYWSGASGRKYIHSVYGLGDCPPLPGAIYVAVRREGTLRVALGIGRFSGFWDGSLSGRELVRMENQGIDEIHVHLLAKSPEASEAILQDLVEAFEGECAGMAETQAPVTGSEAFTLVS